MKRFIFQQHPFISPQFLFFSNYLENVFISNQNKLYSTRIPQYVSIKSDRQYLTKNKFVSNAVISQTKSNASFFKIPFPI